MVTTVKVPKQFEPIFAEAEKTVGAFFDRLLRDPSRGIISIDDERYILIRGEAIFATLRQNMEVEFGSMVTNAFLYDLAKTIGEADARHFSEKLGLSDPLKRLSAGPVHFSHTGWAFVDILPESAPSPDENYILVYDHPNTFESAKFRAGGPRADEPVCLFSAGYSAGWCTHSFGIALDSEEIECVARGDPHCRFVMAPPKRLPERIAMMKKGHAG